MDSGDGAQQLPGVFWLPGQPDINVPGRLVLARQGVHAELAGSLTPPLTALRPAEHEGGVVTTISMEADDRTKNSFVVHGRLADAPVEVTLVDCFTSNRRYSLFGSGPSPEEQHLKPRYVLRGGYIAGADERFIGLRLRLRNIDTWAGLPGFRVENDEHDSKILRYQSVGLGTVKLTHGGALGLWPEHGVIGPTEQGGSFYRHLWFELLNFPDMTWHELDWRVVTPLFSLITLCTRRNCRPVRAMVQTNKGTWLELMRFDNHELGEDVSSHEMLLRLRDLTLAGVASWLNAVDLLGHLPPVVADMDRRSKLTLETQVLELATVAEGLHRRLFAEDRRVEDDDARRIRTNVERALEGEDPRHKQIILSYLKYLHEPSYKRRLQRLADEASQVVPGVIGDSNKWANVVSDCRNTFAHKRGTLLEAGDIDTYVGVELSLRWVLWVNLIRHTGIDSAILAERIQQDQSYLLEMEQITELLGKRLSE